AHSLLCLSLVASAKSSHQEALNYALKAVELLQFHKVQSGLLNAEANQTLGSLLKKHSKSTQALALLKEALDVKLEILGECHPDMASIFYELGDLYQRQGKLKEAL